MRPWRLPFHASPVVRKGPFSSKSVSSQDPLSRKLRNLSLPSLNFCPTFSSQATKFGKFQFTSPQIWKFSVHKPPVRGKYQFASPTIGKFGPHIPTWKKLSAPPHPRSFGHPNVRAVISLSLNYCARKGVTKEHRAGFFLFVLFLFLFLFVFVFCFCFCLFFVFVCLFFFYRVIM